MTKISSGVFRLYQWIITHKKHVAMYATLIVVFGILPLVGFAQDTPATSGSPDMASLVLSNPAAFFIQLVLGFLTWLANICISATGKLIVTLMGMIIIPILGYNNFGDSSVIDIGWPLVRDVVNMFVIVVLIVIAVQTILGYSKAKWETQLPRFFIAIVLVNFSRTITLIMVDVSQVIMFTFVNALRDIAAGNFMNLFQLNEFVTVNSGLLETMSGSGGGATATGEVSIESYQLFGTSIMVLALLLVVLGTLIILAVVFVYRIVVLWVLIILSPIAFFMGGVKDLFGEASGKYSEWWSMFTAALTLGPIMTFFLWLALAAASSEPLAVSEGMNFTGTEDVPSLFAEIFMSEHMLSLLLALILIMTGFKMASGAAGKLGNFAAKLITEDAGQRLVKFGFTGLPSLGYRAGRAGVRTGWRAGKAVGGAGLALGKKAGLEGLRQFESRTGMGQDLGKSITQIGETFARTGVAGRFIGSRIMGAGGKLEGAAAASVAAARGKAREDIDKMTTAERAAHLANVQRDPVTGEVVAPVLQRDRHRQEALLTDLATNKDFQKEMKKKMPPAEYERLMQDALRHADKNDDELTDSQKAAFKKTRAGNLSTWVAGKNDKDAADEIDKVLSDSDFRVDQLSEDDMKDERVQEALKKRVTRTYRDQNGVLQSETMWDQIEKGQGVSNKVKDAAQGVGATFANAMAAELAQALKHGHLDIGSLTAGDLGAAGSPREKEVAKAMAMSGADLGKLDPALRARMLSAIGNVKTDATTRAGAAGISPEEKAKWERRAAEADRATFSAMTGATAADRDAAAAHIGVNAAGTVDPAHRENVREVITSQPTQIFKFETAINAAAAAGAPNDITKEIVRSMSHTNIQQMRNELKKARALGTPAGAAEEARIKKSIEMSMKAFQAEQAAAGGPAGLDNETKEMLRKLENLNRY